MGMVQCESNGSSMQAYHWFGVLLAITACYASESFEVVPEISKSFSPTFKGVTPSPLFKFTTALVGEEKFEIVPKLLNKGTVPSFKVNPFKVSPFVSTPFKFTPSFMQGEEKFELVPELLNKFSVPNVPSFKFTPTFINGEETFELVPELSKRTLIKKPIFENRNFVVPAVKPVYGVPVYVPPRVLPAPPAPKPVYGAPPVIKNVGSSSITIDPVFDYTMISSLVQGMRDFKTSTESLKPGSYEYMSADGVPVSVKIFNDFK